MTAPAIDKPETSLHGPNLILDVENFGPISEAKNIEFKPMTVFVGPSNTGKTYLAMLLHAILRSKESADTGVAVWGTETESIDDPFMEEPFPSFIDDLELIFNQIVNHGISLDKRIPIKVPVLEFSTEGRAYLINATQRFLREYVKSAKESIERYFDVQDLCRLRRSGENLTLRFRLGTRTKYSRFDMLLNEPCVNSFEIADYFQPGFNINARHKAANQIIDELLSNPDIIDAIEDFAYSSLSDMPTSHYFRAGRTGLIDAYRELAATLVRRSTSISGHDTRTNQLAVSVTTSEFLQSLLRTDSRSISNLRSASMSRLADLIEQGVLVGQINVKELSGVTHFEFEQNGVSVPLDRASSMAT